MGKKMQVLGARGKGGGKMCQRGFEWKIPEAQEKNIFETLFLGWVQVLKQNSTEEKTGES